MKRIITFMVILFTFLCLQAQNQGNGGKASNGGRREFSPELYMKTLHDFVAREAKLTEAEATSSPCSTKCLRSSTKSGKNKETS